MDPDRYDQRDATVDSDALRAWEWEGGFINLQFDDPPREAADCSSPTEIDTVITP